MPECQHLRTPWAEHLHFRPGAHDPLLTVAELWVTLPQALSLPCPRDPGLVSPLHPRFFPGGHSHIQPGLPSYGAGDCAGNKPSWARAPGGLVFMYPSSCHLPPRLLPPREPLSRGSASGGARAHI